MSRRPRLVVIVPGNPGNPAFYTRFVQLLAERGHEVALAGHPCLTDAADLGPYAEHQARATREHLARSGRTVDDVELVLVGHSVGAYLCYLLVARGLLPVARVIMLFPFLTRPGRLGRLVLWLVARRWLVRVGLALARALPGPLRRWLARRAGAGDAAATVDAMLPTPEAIGCTAMADTERREIASRRDVAYLEALPLFNDPARFTAVFCDRDTWAPEAVVDQLAPFARRLPPPVSHTFVVHPQQRPILAALLHRLIEGQAGRTATNAS